MSPLVPEGIGFEDSAYTAPTYYFERSGPPSPSCDWCGEPITDEQPAIWRQPNRVLNLDLGNSHTGTRSHAEFTFYGPPRTPHGPTIDLTKVQLHAACVAEIGDTIADWFRALASTKIN